VIGALRRFVTMRVSRRLFVLFLLSAFLPLAVIALLSLTQVRSLLLQLGDQRLGATAKTFGMTVFERLLVAGDVAGAAAFSRTSAKNDPFISRTFTALTIVGEGGKVALLGAPLDVTLGEDAHAHLDKGKPLVIVSGQMRRPTVLLAMEMPAPSKSIVVGELKPEYLWGAPEELPLATDFCVYEEETRVWLYCSAAIDVTVLEAVGKPTASVVGATAWSQDGTTYRSRAWTQFMRASFGARDWVVVATQPEAFQLSHAIEFQRQYVPVILLALLIAIWLTVRQSRDIVDPVTRLADRARGIARKDFSVRLGLKREDEFGELGAAIDQMSQRLGRQFDSLTALAEIDRLILSTQDTALVVRIVLQRLGDALGADVASLTLFDQEDRDRGRTYYRPPDARDSCAMVRHEVEAADRARLDDAKSRWMHGEKEGRWPTYLGPMGDYGIRNVFVQPISWRDAVCGALALGFRDDVALDDEAEQQVREFGDRLAVAIGSAWRDEQIYQQSHFDPLTGLPNRLLFKDRLGREIARSQRSGLGFALLFVDLDHFKNVNDSFGPNAGDAILREAGRRISACVRETDTVARLGGDEFTVMLTGLNHPQEAWLLAETIVAAMSREFTSGDQHCFLSASVGIASYPADGVTADELLKSADTAMYRAKASGRAQAVFFEERMNQEAVARLTLDRDLRAAIDRGELVMHYQPQVDLASGMVRGAEALLRWNHPVHGLISPMRFIPLAEESGFIESLGQWTLVQVSRQMAAWRAEGLPIDRVAVNISPRQFRRRLVELIRGAVQDAGIPPSCLEIEITEGLLVDRTEAVESMLREIGNMGHEIALDDFGTGFSSMAYLTRFRVNRIKIDRVFVDGLGRRTDSEPIVAAIIAMSHALGIRVIAEGVETQEQMSVLRGMRCDEIQGFITAPALPPAELATLVRARAKSLATA